MMTTGYRSLLNRIHGGLHALCEQSREKVDLETMKRRIKDIAVAELGYPTQEKPIKLQVKITVTPEGLQVPEYKTVRVREPLSLGKANTEQGMMIQNVIQMIADSYNLYLYEYDQNEEPYRSVGGRTKAQMVDYVAWLRGRGEEEEAKKLEQKPKWKKGDIDIW